MKIEQIEDENKGAFIAKVDGVVAGEVTYVKSSPQLIIADKTAINDAFRGQSIGKKLVYEMVEYARKQHLKIIPLCPYVKSVFDKDSGLEDVRK